MTLKHIKDCEQEVKQMEEGSSARDRASTGNTIIEDQSITACNRNQSSRSRNHEAKSVQFASSFSSSGGSRRTASARTRQIRHKHRDLREAKDRLRVLIMTLVKVRKLDTLCNILSLLWMLEFGAELCKLDNSV